MGKNTPASRLVDDMEERMMPIENKLPPGYEIDLDVFKVPKDLL
jgi:hypothetical protein